MDWVKQSEVTNDQLVEAQQYFHKYGYFSRIEYLVTKDYRDFSQEEKKELLNEYYNDKFHRM